MMARVSVNPGNQGWIRSSIVTVASELNAEDMVLERRGKRRAVLGLRAKKGRTQDTTEGSEA